MKKFLLTCMMFFAVTTQVYAAGCDDIQMPRGTSDTVIIEMKKKCLELTPNTGFINPISSSNELTEYAELGKKYGLAMVEVAKAVGTTVNELAQTPVGMFLLFLVAYQVMGNDLIGIFGGTIWFATMLPLWLYMLHRLILNNRTVTETYGENGKLQSRKKSPFEWTNENGAVFVVLCFAFLLICGSGFFMVFG